jgi:hypothetical protein
VVANPARVDLAISRTAPTVSVGKAIGIGVRDLFISTFAPGIVVVQGNVVFTPANDNLVLSTLAPNVVKISGRSPTRGVGRFGGGEKRSRSSGSGEKRSRVRA